MCVCVRVRVCVRLFVCVCAYVQGGKKTRYFVMCLQFVVFNIFSHFLHHFVDEYQENLAYKFELCCKIMRPTWASVGGGLRWVGAGQPQSSRDDLLLLSGGSSLSN